MKYILIVLPEADRDVEDIALLIAQDSWKTALKFYEAVTESYGEIESTPLAWVKVNAKALGLKKFHKRGVKGFGNFLIFYRVDGKTVYVVRVFHGSRDIARVLGRELLED